MKKNIFKVALATLSALGLSTISSFQVSQLASTLGLSGYAAEKVIDIVSTAGSIWSIVGIVAVVIGGGGIGVGILASAKALAVRYGKRAAAAW